jgi:hypothetical protein
LVCYRCTIHHPLRIQSHSRKSCIFSELFRDLGPKRRQARTPSPMQSRSLHPHIIHINLLLVALLHISSHPSYKYTIISSHLISSHLFSNPADKSLLQSSSSTPNQTQTLSYNSCTCRPSPCMLLADLSTWRTACTRRGRLFRLCTRSRAWVLKSRRRWCWRVCLRRRGC